MPDPDFPELPRHEIITSTLLVAGAVALPVAGLDPASAKGRRLSLSHSGVVEPDGSPVASAATVYRNRRFGATGSIPQPELHLPGLAIYGGVIGPAFGHQITQSAGRLWAGALAPGAPILFLPEQLSMTAIPDHFTSLVRSLGVQNDLRLVTSPALCESLLVPAEICNLDHRPCTTPYFRHWLARHLPAPQGEAATDIYVSRSRLPLTNGQFLQETLLELALQTCGYRVLYPETMTIPQQLDAYAGARRLIFADGSAAHLWSFVAKPGQKVAVVLRRPTDRKFARWFRSFDVPPPAYLDHGIADFWRRGEGPGRSIALLDLRALWAALRARGFHDAKDDLGPDLGPDRDELEVWLSRPAPLQHLLADPPPGLDPRSRDLLALRSFFARRAAALPAPNPASA